MSILPYQPLFYNQPDHSFGLGYHPNELSNSTCRPGYYSNYPNEMRPNLETRERNISARNTEISTGIKITGKEGFQVSLDVHHFAPNELSVRTVDDNIVVEGKHDEKEDEHGHIYRRFVRRYTLPEELDVKNVVSTLSSDGVLTIRALPSSKAIESNDREVHIQHTGPAHLSIKPIVQRTTKE